MVVTKDESTGLLTIKSVKGENEEFVISDVDCLLWAVGRTPNINNLGLEKLVSILVCNLLLTAVKPVQICIFYCVIIILLYLNMPHFCLFVHREWNLLLKRKLKLTR